MPNFVAPMIGRGAVLQTPAADGIDGQDASTPESHAAILRVIAGYCNELADKLTAQGS